MARRKSIPSKPKELPSSRKRKAVSGVFRSVTSPDTSLSVDDEWARLADEAEPTWFIAAG